MNAYLHNMQYPVNGRFAYHAMEGARAGCDTAAMRIMLRHFRERLGLNQEEVAERSGFSISQISRWESGASNIPSERLPALARAYECRIRDIFQDDEGFMPPGPLITVKGKVAAGQWMEAWEIDSADAMTFTGRHDLDVPMRDRFGVLVEGDSMNMIYPSGTMLECVAFYSDVEIKTGRRVIVQRINLGGDIECTVKEYMVDESGVEWLVPRSFNPSFQSPVRVDMPGDDIVEVRIVGIVVGSYRPES